MIHPLLSGNKYRKLFSIINQTPFSHNKIISYGGIQSNAMLSIAALASQKKVPFVYYTRYLPADLDLHDASNYTMALSLGMQIIVSKEQSDEGIRSELMKSQEKDTLFIPQGGAGESAFEGIKVLGDEIIAFVLKNKINNLAVITPSGTGTTAIWLQQVLKPYNIQVVTTAVVGSTDYLKEQMLRQSDSELPLILETKTKYRFAKPHTNLLKNYLDFKRLGIEVDMIYATVMFQALDDNQHLFKEKTLLYIHSGGVLGNQSQLKRYEKLSLSS